MPFTGDIARLLCKLKDGHKIMVFPLIQEHVDHVYEQVDGTNISILTLANGSDGLGFAKSYMAID